MADFCRHCSIKMFGSDYGDMKNLCSEDEIAAVLCEECGSIFVNHLGECITHNHPELKESEPDNTPLKFDDIDF